jgi:hypothetical protein
MRTLTPSPPLPRKRGREQTEFAARSLIPPHTNSGAIRICICICVCITICITTLPQGRSDESEFAA